MNKRLLKRHKRQVSRAKERVRLSEPDLRSSDQLRAAREASRPDAGRRNDPFPHYSTPAIRIHADRPTGSTTKADG